MNPAFPKLYAILSAEMTASTETVVAQSLADAGVELIQYRNKAASPGALFEISSRIARSLAGRNARFIVNDRPDIACLVGAGGVHVGQEDMPVEDARAICGEASSRNTGASTFGAGFWVGLSTHNLHQVCEAAKTSADYIAVGPIFPTGTKKNPDPVVGTEFIRSARTLTRKPLVAIGGITLSRAPEVFLAGADCLAVASDLVGASDPAARARGYLAVAADCSK
jgi:thiamine-phosphate pyrophosphorylase